MESDVTLLELKDLKKHFPARGRRFIGKEGPSIKAVDGVDLTIKRGETLGLVGESGCGKTTIFRTILRLESPTSGHVLLYGEDVHAFKGDKLKQYRVMVQAVFQDPWSSLNPRMMVKDSIGEALVVNRKVTKAEVEECVRELLARVGLHAAQAPLFPHQFSGGQRQRIAVAAALVSDPDLILLDEPVSALDVSIRAQIMNLLADLQQKNNVAYLMIAHNLAAVRFLAHRTAVMYLGKIVEHASTEELFKHPLHPYTQALFSAALPSEPGVEWFEAVLTGEIPSPMHPPPGCSFHPRCPAALANQKLMKVCASIAPRSLPVAPGHTVACHLYARGDGGDAVEACG